MPFYKLLCRRCGEAFEKRASIEDRTNRRIPCPRCGSALLENDCGCSCESCAGSGGGGE